MQNTIRTIINKQVKLVDKDQKNNIGQKIIDNKYVICLREMLGAGAYASVYKGYFVENPLMKLAIKVIPVSKLNEKQIFKYFQREQQIASKLNHPNIVQFIDVCQNEDNLYLILEYCEEGNLKKILDQQPNRQFQFQQAFDIFSALIHGYEALYHTKVIHRDLKPENIIFKEGIAKIADFGFAKIVEDMNVSDSHTTLGTPLYCAPEILEGKRYNSKADVWSLGCIFYEMLYGRAPFNAANIPNLVEQAKKGLSRFPQEVKVDENVLNLLKGMLQPDKVKRSRWDQIFAHSYFAEYEPSIILTQINPTDSQFIYVDLQRNCLEQRLTQIVKNFRFWKEINEYLTKVAREAYQVMHYLKISSKNQILLMVSSAMMVLLISSNLQRLISEKPLSFEIGITIEDIKLLMTDRTKYTENLNWINYQFYIMANYIEDLKQKIEPETVQLISELLKGTKLDTKIVENIQMSIKQCVMELQNKISPSQGQSPLLIIIEKCITVYYIPRVCFNLEQTLEILHYLQLKQMPNTNRACLSKTQNNEYKLIVA